MTLLRYAIERGWCGGRGIRTPEGLAALAVFKTAPINHSGIPPRADATHLMGNSRIAQQGGRSKAGATLGVKPGSE